MQIVQAIAMLATILESAQKMATVINDAAKQGRDLTLDEIKQFQAEDDSARKVLADAIAAAEADEVRLRQWR